MKYNLIQILWMAVFWACTPSEDQIPDPNQLKVVDQAFSRLSEAKGMNHAFASYIDERGVILRNNSMPIVGKDKVVARLSQNADTTFRLTWEPMFADIARSGDLGYTYGTYLVASLEGDSLGAGTYVSIWKKDNEGNWKFVFDAGNDGL